MAMVNGSSHTRFILTTREHILRAALQMSERLAKSPILEDRCILELSYYSYGDKARILYNHLYFSKSVDGGQLNLMSDNTTGGDRKESSVDLTGWTWRDNGTTYGPFSVTFTAQDLSGFPVKSTTITIYRAK